MNTSLDIGIFVLVFICKYILRLFRVKVFRFQRRNQDISLISLNVTVSSNDALMGFMRIVLRMHRNYFFLSVM